MPDFSLRFQEPCWVMNKRLLYSEGYICPV